MSTCNWLDLETLGSRPIMPKNLPRTPDPLHVKVKWLLERDAQADALLGTTAIIELSN